MATGIGGITPKLKLAVTCNFHDPPRVKVRWGFCDNPLISLVSEEVKTIESQNIKSVAMAIIVKR